VEGAIPGSGTAIHCSCSPSDGGAAAAVAAGRRVVAVVRRAGTAGKVVAEVPEDAHWPLVAEEVAGTGAQVVAVVPVVRTCSGE